MSKFIFITGGARSGKSGFALKIAEGFGERKIFVATARITDPEMEERVQRHRSERGDAWKTFEEPLTLLSRIRSLPEDSDVVVVDCITVFLTNLIIEKRWSDIQILDEVDGIVSSIRGACCPVIAVSNEVGMGLVPADPLGRRFRDLAGTVNRKLAASADAVYLVSMGIPLRLKGELRRSAQRNSRNHGEHG